MAEIKDKKPNAWLIALRKWNEGKGSWSMPKKGSKEYEEVRGLMGKGETPKDVPKEAPKDIPKEAPKAKTGRLRDVPVVAPAPVAPAAPAGTVGTAAIRKKKAAAVPAVPAVPVSAAPHVPQLPKKPRPLMTVERKSVVLA